MKKLGVARRPREGLVERAFKLARSRRFSRIEEIRAALIGEGYDNVDAHLAGRLIRTQLLRESQAASRRGGQDRA